MLILGILLNFFLDISHKQNRFSKTLLKKFFKFVASKKDSTIRFNLILLAKVDSIAKKQNYKRYVFRMYNTSCIKKFFALLVKMIALYIQSLIV